MMDKIYLQKQYSYHKVKAEDSCIDHSDAICRWLYMDSDSTFDNTLSQNKNSNHQNIYDDSSKYHGEKSESNFERDKNRILDAIAFFGEDEDD